MPLSKGFLFAFALIILAALAAFVGLIPLALLFGLPGGFLLIKEMIAKFNP